MKIAISGSGSGNNKEILEISKEIGREIAKHNHILLVGGCKGYPYAAERGALLEKGKVIVYSPAKDGREHIEKYNFPTDEGAEYAYTGLGIPKRNYPLIKNSDLVIILDGQTGTLNEFTLAFHEKKKIFVLKKGELHKLIPKIAEVCNKTNEKDNVFYFNDVGELKDIL